MRFLKALKLLLLVGFLVSCGSYHHENSQESEVTPSDKLISEISYARVYDEVFRSKCVACHGPSGGINLESYEEAKKHLGVIKDVAVTSRRMPKSPYAPLSDDQLLVLAAWIAAGGPYLPIGGGHAPEPEPLKPEFNSIKKNIFEVKCMSCHTHGGEAEKISLETRDDLVNSPREIVIPGNAEESGLFLVLQKDAIKKMPPPDSDIEPVDDESVKVIKDWINGGGLN